MSALRKGLAPLVAAMVVLVACAGSAVASHPGKGTPNLGKSCDGASNQGLQSRAHQHCTQQPPPTTDAIIDADGIATPQSGDPAAREVVTGSPLTTFPVTGVADAGLDMFDQDTNQAWTQGVDDLHAEDPATCPTAFRDGIHELGFDCKVLDINGDLANGEPVDCDLEVGVSFSGMPCPPPDVKYHDTNSDSAWDSGEDLVQDVNNNGVFD
jgi:hypothetical protein